MFITPMEPGIYVLEKEIPNPVHGRRKGVQKLVFYVPYSEDTWFEARRFPVGMYFIKPSGVVSFPPGSPYPLPKKQPILISHGNVGFEIFSELEEEPEILRWNVLVKHLVCFQDQGRLANLALRATLDGTLSNQYVSNFLFKSQNHYHLGDNEVIDLIQRIGDEDLRLRLLRTLERQGKLSPRQI